MNMYLYQTLMCLWIRNFNIPTLLKFVLVKLQSPELKLVISSLYKWTILLCN